MVTHEAEEPQNPDKQKEADKRLVQQGRERSRKMMASTSAIWHLAGHRLARCTCPLLPKAGHYILQNMAETNDKIHVLIQHLLEH